MKNERRIYTTLALFTAGTLTVLGGVVGERKSAGDDKNLNNDTSGSQPAARVNDRVYPSLPTVQGAGYINPTVGIPVKDLRMMGKAEPEVISKLVKILFTPKPVVSETDKTVAVENFGEHKLTGGKLGFQDEIEEGPVISPAGPETTNNKNSSLEKSYAPPEMQESYSALYRPAFEKFKTDNPEEYRQLLERAGQFLDGYLVGKDRFYLNEDYGNVWGVDLTNPDNIAWILYHYEKFYSGEQMDSFLERLTPGLRAGNRILTNCLKGVIDGKIVPRIPDTVEDINQKIAFVLPDVFGPKEIIQGTVVEGLSYWDGYGVLLIYPPSAVYSPESERMLRVQYSACLAHEELHPLENFGLDPDSPLFVPMNNESHYLIGVFAASVNALNGLEPGISSGNLLVMQRLREAGIKDPYAEMIRAAVYPGRALSLAKIYDEKRKPGDPSFDQIIAGAEVQLPLEDMIDFLVAVKQAAGFNDVLVSEQ